MRSGTVLLPDRSRVYETGLDQTSPSTASTSRAKGVWPPSLFLRCPWPPALFSRLRQAVLLSGLLLLAFRHAALAPGAVVMPRRALGIGLDAWRESGTGAEGALSPRGPSPHPAPPRMPGFVPGPRHSGSCRTSMPVVAVGHQPRVCWVGSRGSVLAHFPGCAPPRPPSPGRGDLGLPWLPAFVY